jgi:hypothetical protein
MGKDKPAKGDAKKAPEAKPEEKKSSSPANEAKKEGKKDAKKKSHEFNTASVKHSEPPPVSMIDVTIPSSHMFQSQALAPHVLNHGLLTNSVFSSLKYCLR